MSSCDFNVVLYLYSGIMSLPHSCGIMLLWKQYETIQGLSFGITADFDCGIMPTLLRLDCRLDSSFHRTACSITANLSDLYTAHQWAVATSMSSYIFIVALMPFPHSCGNMLLWKQYETIQGLSCGITANFDCGNMPTLLRLDCQLNSSSHRTTCGTTADSGDLYSGIDATSTLLWNYAAMKAVWDHTRSFLQHHADFDWSL
jgi:hypothetical protein